MSGHQATDREDEVRRIVEQLAAWAEQRPEIRALAMVGSYARGTPHPDSDLDLIILTGTPERFTESSDWLDILDRPPIIRQQQFGAITEQRVRLPSGLEIEFGIGTPVWASASPLDPGTARVTRDGLHPLHDPDRLLAKLQAAISAPG